VSDAVCCHRTSHILLMGVDVAAVAFGGGCCWPQRTRITSHPLCVLCVLCLVSFHFRFTFFPFALLLPTFIVELYSCRFHFIFYFIVFFFFVQLAFFPSRCGFIFGRGGFNLYGTYNSIVYASDFDPFSGGWDRFGPSVVWPPPRQH